MPHARPPNGLDWLHAVTGKQRPDEGTLGRVGKSYCGAALLGFDKWEIQGHLHVFQTMMGYGDLAATSEAACSLPPPDYMCAIAFTQRKPK